MRLAYIKPIFLLSITLFFFSGCSTMVLFDQYSYKETIAAKVDALALMEKADEEYEEHREEAEEVFKDMQKIYEYERNRPKNVETTKMWEIMLNPERNMYAGFMQKWENEGSMNPIFVEEASKQVEKGFDVIIDLESKKIKPEEANSIIDGFN